MSARHDRNVSRRSLMGIALLGASTLVAEDGMLPASGVQTSQSVVDNGYPSTQAFLDSAGVNVHWGYTNTPYFQRWSVCFRRLRELGVRHVRGTADRADSLRRAGIRTTVLVDLGPDGLGSPVERMKALSALVQVGAVDAVEGPNEPDLFWTREDATYSGLPWVKGVELWQRELFASARSMAPRKKLAVIGPALGGTYWGRSAPFPPSSFISDVDFGNFHPYPRGNPFTPRSAYAGVPAYYWDTDFPSSTLDKYPINLRWVREIFGRRPIMATETGYSTWAQGPNEYVQGLYTPRVLLENFRLGIRRSYLYELLDEFDDPSLTNREAHFGLLRNDLSAKPAFNAVRSILSLCRTISGRQTAVFAPSIRPTVPAGYDPSYVHHVILWSGGDNYTIFMWHEVAAETTVLDNVVARRPIDSPAIPVRIDWHTGFCLNRAWRLDDEGMWTTVRTSTGQVTEFMLDGHVSAFRVGRSKT